MKILDQAVKLEKALLDRLGRRTDIRRHPIELYRDILDEIEDASDAGARGGRIFPYNAITVMVPTTNAHQRATAEAVFTEAPTLEERVRARLRHGGCADVDGLAVALKFVDGTSDEWSGREYHIELRRRAMPRQSNPAVKARTDEVRELHLVVVAGTVAKERFRFSTSRINLGRLAEVLDRQQRIVRQNHVAFVDGDDDVSQSVSRAHAHIRFETRAGEARLHDDGSTHGTRVVRGGRTIDVPRGGGRGLTLRDGDEVLLGQARVRVELRRSGGREGLPRRATVRRRRDR